MVSTRKQKVGRANTDEDPPTNPKGGRRRTVKVKNKVASPAAKGRARATTAASPALSEVSSDEYNYSDEEAETKGGSGKESDYQSDSSQQSRRTRLPFNVQRAILLEIQKRGGIVAFDKDNKRELAAICNGKKSLFGEPNSTLRKAIQKKVVRLKTLCRDHPTKYQNLLREFGVDSNNDEDGGKKPAAQEKPPPATVEKPQPTTAEKPPKPPTKPAPTTSEPTAGKPPTAEKPPTEEKPPKPAPTAKKPEVQSHRKTPKPPAAMSNSKPGKRYMCHEFGMCCFFQPCLTKRPCLKSHYSRGFEQARSSWSFHRG